MINVGFIAIQIDKAILDLRKIYVMNTDSSAIAMQAAKCLANYREHEKVELDIMNSWN